MALKLPAIGRSKSSMAKYTYEAVGEFRTIDEPSEREQVKTRMSYAEEDSSFQHALAILFPITDKKRGVKFKRDKVNRRSRSVSIQYEKEVKRMASNGERITLPQLV